MAFKYTGTSPDGRTVTFETEQEISDAEAQELAAYYLNQGVTQGPSVSAPPQETGFFPGVEQGFRQAVGTGLFGVGELTGLEGLAKAGEEFGQTAGYQPISWEETKAA